MSKKVIKYTVFLVALGVICGLLLAFVNSITAPIIEERAKEEAIAALREEFTYEDFTLNIIDEYDNVNPTITAIYHAFNEDGKLAAIIYQTAASGFSSGPTVVSFVEIKADGTFGKTILISHGDTPSFADNVFGHDFGIEDAGINSYSPVIKSGATATSGGVITGINAAVAHFKTIDNVGGITND